MVLIILAPIQHLQGVCVSVTRPRGRPVVGVTVGLRSRELSRCSLMGTMSLLTLKKGKIVQVSPFCGLIYSKSCQMMTLGFFFYGGQSKLFPQLIGALCPTLAC